MFSLIYGFGKSVVLMWISSDRQGTYISHGSCSFLLLLTCHFLNRKHIFKLCLGEVILLQYVQSASLSFYKTNPRKQWDYRSSLLHFTAGNKQKWVTMFWSHILLLEITSILSPLCSQADVSNRTRHSKL